MGIHLRKFVIIGAGPPPGVGSILDLAFTL